MKTVMVIGTVIAWLVVGYITTMIIRAVEEEDIGDDIELIPIWFIWPLVLVLWGMWKLIPWIGKRVAAGVLTAVVMVKIAMKRKDT